MKSVRLVLYVLITMFIFVSIIVPATASGAQPGDSCGTSDVYDCNLNCFPASYEGDEFCDDGPNYPYADFMCPELNYDGGDCGAVSPHITSPDPGSTLSGSTETFSWTANGTAVSSWYLWAGSCNSATYGGCGHDYYNSGAIGAGTLTATASGLPTDGSTVYVRLWYYLGGWQSVLYTYTAISGPQPGDSCGTNDVYDCNLNCFPASYEGDDFCDDGPNYPYADFMCPELNYDGGDCGGSPHITSPDPGSTLSGSTETFSWTANGTAVSSWYLWAGSCNSATYGGCGHDYYNSGAMGAGTLTATASGLPTDGSTVYVRLWYYLGGWQSVDFQYTAAGGGGGGTPAIMSPDPGSTLSGSTETFSWTANGTAVSSWYLWAGSCNSATYGGCGHDYYNSGAIGAGTLTATASGLPTDGSTVYVRLWYYLGGWQSVLYTYTAISGPQPGDSCGTNDVYDCNLNCFPASYEGDDFCDDGPNYPYADFMCPELNYDGGDCGGSPHITSPDPGSTLSGSTETFTWTANGATVSEWWLWVGTSHGGQDILNSGSLGSSTSLTVHGLPTNGNPVYVRLHYNSGGWQSVDFQYTAAGGGGGGTPAIMSPAPGTTLSGSTETFTWIANGATVSEWWLWVGTSHGGQDILNSGSLGSSTSLTVHGLPTDGSTVFVRLHYNSGGWQSVDFQYTANTVGVPHTYAIGDTGPAGGIVFYVTDGGLHGLEAAPADQGSAEWGCWPGMISGADGTALGTGAQNTADILASCSEAGIAAELADNYSLNGYNDWFLPSKDELNLLYQQKHVVGGFNHATTNTYWSSTEASFLEAYDAWYQYFVNGSQDQYSKTASYRVRAVRAF